MSADEAEATFTALGMPPAELCPSFFSQSDACTLDPIWSISAQLSPGTTLGRSQSSDSVPSMHFC